MRWTIREGEKKDAAALVALIDAFAQGHPAAAVRRDADKIARYYFGERPAGNVVLAEIGGRAIAFAVWRMSFDIFWCKEYGEVMELFVEREYRGCGVAATLLAFICGETRRSGGEYLCGYPSEVAAKFCERFAIGYPSRWYHVSERAFQRLADLAGVDPRTVATMLPEKSWNKVGAAQHAVAADGQVGRSAPSPVRR